MNSPLRNLRLLGCETVYVSPANSFSGGRRRCLGILIENEVVTLGSQHKDKQLSLLRNCCERLTSVLDHWISGHVLCLCWRFAILKKFGVLFSIFIFPEMTQFSTNRGIPSWQKWRAVRPILRLYGFAFSLRFSDDSGCRGRLFCSTWSMAGFPQRLVGDWNVFFLGVTSVLKKNNFTSLVTYLQLIFILSLDMEIKKIPSSCGWKDEIHFQWLWSNYSDLTGPHPKR